MRRRLLSNHNLLFSLQCLQHFVNTFFFHLKLVSGLFSFMLALAKRFLFAATYRSPTEKY